MTRDELLESIKKEVCNVLPENEELSGDDLDSVQSTVEEVLTNATEAIDEGVDSADDEG